MTRDITLDEWDRLQRRVAVIELQLDRLRQDIAALRQQSMRPRADVPPGHVRVSGAPYPVPAAAVGGCCDDGGGD